MSVEGTNVIDMSEVSEVEKTEGVVDNVEEGEPQRVQSPKKVVDLGGGGDAAITLELTKTIEGEGSSEDETGSGSSKENKKLSESDMSEFFMKQISKKKNIYSNDAIPLNSPWTFWVDRNQRGVNAETFEANLKRIYTSYTVQRFWNVYVNLPKPSQLNIRASLHMMRDERKPMWEESYNQRGGSFRVRIQKKDTDKVWKEVLLAAIGEQYSEFVSPRDEICGVSISIREREDMLVIWNTNAEEAGLGRVFTCLRMLLPDTVFAHDHYKPHVTHQAFEKKKLVKPVNNRNENKDPNTSGSDNSVLNNSSGSEKSLSACFEEE